MQLQLYLVADRTETIDWQISWPSFYQWALINSFIHQCQMSFFKKILSNSNMWFYGKLYSYKPEFSYKTLMINKKPFLKLLLLLNETDKFHNLSTLCNHIIITYLIREFWQTISDYFVVQNNFTLLLSNYIYRSYDLNLLLKNSWF